AWPLPSGGAGAQAALLPTALPNRIVPGTGRDCAGREGVPMEAVPRVVLDINVLVAAAYNPDSASRRVVAACLSGELAAVLSLALRREHEFILPRAARGLPPYVGIPTQPFMTRPVYLGLQHQGFAAGDPSAAGYAPPSLGLRGGVTV